MRLFGVGFPREKEREEREAASIGVSCYSRQDIALRREVMQN